MFNNRKKEPLTSEYLCNEDFPTSEYLAGSKICFRNGEGLWAIFRIENSGGDYLMFLDSSNNPLLAIFTGSNLDSIFIKPYMVASNKPFITKLKGSFATKQVAMVEFIRSCFQSQELDRITIRKPEQTAKPQELPKVVKKPQVIVITKQPVTQKTMVVTRPLYEFVGGHSGFYDFSNINDGTLMIKMSKHNNISEIEIERISSKHKLYKSGIVLGFKIPVVWLITNMKTILQLNNNDDHTVKGSELVKFIHDFIVNKMTVKLNKIEPAKIKVVGTNQGLAIA